MIHENPCLSPLQSQISSENGQACEEPDKALDVILVIPSYPLHLLHVSSDAEHEAQVDTKRPNVRPSLRIPVRHVGVRGESPRPTSVHHVMEMVEPH